MLYRIRCAYASVMLELFDEFVAREMKEGSCSEEPWLRSRKVAVAEEGEGWVDPADANGELEARRKTSLNPHGPCVSLAGIPAAAPLSLPA